MPETTEALSFADMVAANQAAEAVPHDLATLQTPYSFLRVRQFGLRIMDLNLTPESAPELAPEELIDGSDRLRHRVDVLYSDPALGSPKLDASHVMSPAGPYDGVGGKHGFPRWVDYELTSRNVPGEGDRQNPSMKLSSQRPETGPTLEKVFVLGHSAMDSFSTLYNQGEDEATTSIGEHNYFRQPKDSIGDLTINGQSIDGLLGKGSLDKLLKQEALIWEGFEGEAVVGFPAGHQVQLKAAIIGGMVPVDMWIWHRGNDSVCLEPVAGTRGGRNDGIVMAAGGLATLYTQVKLL